MIILLKFSEHRDFSLSMNAHFNKRIPAKITRFNGSFMDLLVLVLIDLTWNCHPLVKYLARHAFTILCNVSPYIMKLSMEASMKLFALLKACCKPKHLFRKEDNFVFISMGLIILNNILQYQYKGNENVAYGLLHHAETFENLQKLSLDDYEAPEKKTHFEPTQEWVHVVFVTNISLITG